MHPKTPSSGWTDDKVASSRELWDEGLPSAEIGRRLGISKNAVIGKAWRLELPPRRVSDTPNPVPGLAEIMPPGTPVPLASRTPRNGRFPVLQRTGRRRQAVLRNPLQQRLCASLPTAGP